MDEVLTFAFGPDGSGGRSAAAAARAADVAAPEGGFAWVHVNASGPVGQDWLAGAGFDTITLAALTASETRPRATVHGDTVLMNLRGVNLNPGAEPEDMVSLRLFISARLVVTVERRELNAVDDVIAGFARGAGPASPGDLVARIALRSADRAEPVVARLNERIDDLEETSDAEGFGARLRGELADIRRMAILMRRYMFPQRDALSSLEIEDVPWLDSHARARLREATERVTRLAEELDAIRDRAQVVHDMVMDLRSEAMNRQMLLLSVVSAIFLPLGFLTGLLGINVGGMPGAQNPWAFWIVVALLVALAGGLFWLFRKLGFLGAKLDK
ncbi:zinc transporter ZntB [Sinisalibacter aestuarii]|uniref:Zinc transporter ZntB n=1 Tax=Sinisalibacter aestuarii TaxID=2949426 RepID=A0ABQ5LQH4_9RHOB|nr:zinc transporter ZntB [Sinisalibacter aestuarii]GKY87174.1 zinc transporter ZntB [Sinisalibacter aestuarii]